MRSGSPQLDSEKTLTTNQIETILADGVSVDVIALAFATGVIVVIALGHLQLYPNRGVNGAVMSCMAVGGGFG